MNLGSSVKNASPSHCEFLQTQETLLRLHAVPHTTLLPLSGLLWQSTYCRWWYFCYRKTT